MQRDRGDAHDRRAAASRRRDHLPGGSPPKKPAAMLSRWPIPMPERWSHLVARPQAEAELQALRRSVARGRPFGSDRWAQRTAKQYNLESTFRPQGRPRKEGREGVRTIFRC